MERIVEIPTNPEHPQVSLPFEKPRTEIVNEPSLLYHVVKQLLDIVLAAIGIVVLIPVFLLVALCIKLDDGGDIFHLREIIGKNGRHFYAFKFRTMVPNADEYLEQYPALKEKYQQNMKLSGDPRVTRLGKFLRKTSIE